MKRYIYLISPQKIRGLKFYKELNKVLKANKVKYFQLRLKKTSNSNLLKISKKVKKIVKRNNVKFIINDKPDLIIGVAAGFLSHVGKLLHIPVFVLDDTEHSQVEIFCAQSSS